MSTENNATFAAKAIRTELIDVLRTAAPRKDGKDSGQMSALKGDRLAEPDQEGDAPFLRRVLNPPGRHCLFVVLFYSLLFIAFFSPSLFNGKLLAVGGDGLYIHLPNFHSSKVLWDTMIFSGFPMMADPEVTTWYPPAILLSLLPGSWNVFVILAYVAASAFTYGYVYTITESRLAAFVSGIAFSMSGFMMAQLGNAVIIHSTAWVPLVVWSLEKLRRRTSAAWLVTGSVGLALCLLGGQPQIFFSAAILSIAYAIMRGWSAPVGRRRYYSVSLLMLILGASLAAVQIIPTAELLGQSIRAKFGFHDFISYSLPPRQALTLIFPMVFGGMPQAGLPTYFGADNQTELTGYVGLLPLVLAAVGLVIHKQKALSWFWLGAALLAFTLALGDATPLARILFHVPILKSFRVPARHFMELAFAASVLSGLGVAAIVRQQISKSLVRKVILLSSLAMIVSVALLFMNAGYMKALATEKGAAQLSLLPWANRAVGIPLIIFLLIMAVLTYWRRQPRSILRSVLLLLVLVVDLGSFGWFYQWRYFPLDKRMLAPPETTSRYKNSLAATNQRLMSYRSYRGTTAEMPPNLTRLWGVPNASGYNALIFLRISNLLPMIDQPGLPLPWSEPENRSLDLMAARYLFLPGGKPTSDGRGVSWFGDDLVFWLGSGCNERARQSVTFTLPATVKSTTVGIVSRLACSTQIPDGAEVMRLHLSDRDGTVRTSRFLAGRDSSEWAYDCGSVKPQMRHQRAEIFGSYPAKMYDERCEGHFYVTRVPLDGIRNIKSIEFEWAGGPGAIMLDKVSLIDDEAGSSHPVDPALIDSGHWRFLEQSNEARVYENLGALPRAWLTSEVLSVKPEEALRSIETSEVASGRPFDPLRTALVEGPLVRVGQQIDDTRSASVTELSETRMAVRTASTAPGFLVTSDAFYPGWRANVDGQETMLYRADYAFRGVMVPPGQHVVRFDYRPRGIYYGAVITVLSLLVLSAIGFRATLNYANKRR